MGGRSSPEVRNRLCEKTSVDASPNGTVRPIIGVGRTLTGVEAADADDEDLLPSSTIADALRNATTRGHFFLGVDRGNHPTPASSKMSQPSNMMQRAKAVFARHTSYIHRTLLHTYPDVFLIVQHENGKKFTYKYLNQDGINKLSRKFKPGDVPFLVYNIGSMDSLFVAMYDELFADAEVDDKPYLYSGHMAEAIEYEDEPQNFTCKVKRDGSGVTVKVKRYDEGEYATNEWPIMHLRYHMESKLKKAELKHNLEVTWKALRECIEERVKEMWRKANENKKRPREA
jgi:hypothetical protein